MLGQKYDLSDMAAVVRDLPIDGLENGMRLAANGDGAHHVFGFERIERAKNLRPSFFPPSQNIGTASRGVQFEFPIAKTVGLLAIGDEEINKARTHVPRQMLDQDRYRIRFGIEGDE